MDYLVDKLRMIYKDTRNGDGDVLNRAFGHTIYVFLKRKDVVAQAVSWVRAEQTGLWHKGDGRVRPEPLGRKPRFDYDEIRRIVYTIEEHNEEWLKWHRKAGVVPHEVSYEDLDNDPIGVIRDILDFLGLELPPNRNVEAPNVRLADALNDRWIKRYREMAARPA